MSTIFDMKMLLNFRAFIGVSFASYLCAIGALFPFVQGISQNNHSSLKPHVGLFTKFTFLFKAKLRKRCRI